MNEQNTVTFDDRTLLLFEGNLKRIFAMKIGRSTFRELQNTILACSNQNQNQANFLFETLLTGQVKQKLNEKQQEILERCIQNFTIPSRLSKEIFERGDFINIVTSDLVSQNKEFALLNRIKRIDGEEFVFLSDMTNTIIFLSHFIGRLTEVSDDPKARESLAAHKKEIKVIAERLQRLAI